LRLFAPPAVWQGCGLGQHRRFDLVLSHQEQLVHAANAQSPGKV
jgi:hypothetical protein